MKGVLGEMGAGKKVWIGIKKLLMLIEMSLQVRCFLLHMVQTQKVHNIIPTGVIVPSH